MGKPDTGETKCRYNLNMELAKQMRAHLKAIGMTQQEFADICGLPQSQISEAFTALERDPPGLGATESTLNIMVTALDGRLILGTPKGYPKQRPKRVPPVRKAKPKK